MSRFSLTFGPFLILLSIYALGGRTDFTRELVTGALWLAILATVAYWVWQVARNPKERGRSSTARSRLREDKPKVIGLRTDTTRRRKVASAAKANESSARNSSFLRSMLPAPSKLAIFTVLCWGLFLLLQWVGFQNPSFYPAGPDLYDGVYPLESNPWLPTTANSTRGTEFLWLTAGILGWTALTAAFARGPRRISRAVLVVFLGFSVLAAFGTLARLTGTDKILWMIESHTSYFFGTLFYKNHWGEIAVLMSATGIGLARRFWREEKHSGHFPDRTVSFSCLVFLVALTIPLANARGATLALGGVVLAFAITLLRKRKKSSPPTNRKTAPPPHRLTENPSHRPTASPPSALRPPPSDFKFQLSAF